MQIFMLSWYKSMDFNPTNLPLGCFRTEKDAVEAAHGIGPDDLCQEGTITLYRTWFPGFFTGAVPIMKWDYETCYDKDGLNCGRLSDLRILNGQ